MYDLNKVEIDYAVKMLSSGDLCDDSTVVFLKHLEKLLSYRREPFQTITTQAVSLSGIDAASKGDEKINLQDGEK